MFAIDGRLVAAHRILLALLLALAATSAAAQTPAPAAAGAELTIYHVTMGVGDAVYEKFEHNALWVHDPVGGTDWVYNYGAFDFDEPGYWGRFVRGDWLYSLRVDDIRQTLYVYRYLNRSVVVQELNLTPAQRAELKAFLEWNAREENRYYLYDYYYDNCSTRVRDALDRVLGGRLRAATEDSLTGKSFRWHSERLLADDPVPYTGLLIGLGPGADREISAWQEMFLPGKVHEQLRRLQVPDEQGRLVPLVRSERVLFEAVGRPPVREAPPRRAGGYLLAGLLVGAAIAALALGAPRSRAARYGFAAVSGLWLAFAGTAGLLLAGLWAFTNHTIAHQNENLLQLNPLALALLVLAPVLAFGARWAARPARALAFALAGLSLLGLLLKALPGFVQANWAVIALALPPHLALAWAVHRLAGRATETRSPGPGHGRVRAPVGAGVRKRVSA